MDFERNAPCPCGSGKKFKKCHMGREDELVAILAHLPEQASEKICALAEVDYGSCRRMLEGLDWGKLTNSKIGVKFIDLEEYLTLGFVGRQPPENIGSQSAGQMVNPIKTHETDPNHIYVAITPAVTESTLVHLLAHVLDFMVGSGNNPALATALSMDLQLPAELLEHPKEYGDQLIFLCNEFGVDLDAEDAIVEYLHEKGYLIPGSTIKAQDTLILEGSVRRTIEFIRTHREEIDARIKDKAGYRGDTTPKEEEED